MIYVIAGIFVAAFPVFYLPRVDGRAYSSAALAWFLFACAQITSLAFGLLGLVLLLPLSLANFIKDGPPRMRRDDVPWPYQIKVWRFKPIDWIYGNGEDGADGYYGWWVDGRYRDKTRDWPAWWRLYYWSAIRNPTNNLRFVFQWKGGPLKQWNIAGKRWYIRVGWRADTGAPVISAGKWTHDV